MKFDIGLILGAGTIAFPFLVCMLKLKNINSTYYPFVLLIFTGFITELVSYYMILEYGTNMPALNVFSIFESLLIVMQFHRWGFLRGTNQRLFYSLFVAMLLGWIAENLLFSTLEAANRYYLLSYYFLLVLLSIRQINRDMTNGESTRDELARLLICIGILLFFTFGIIRETFTIFGEHLSKDLMKRIFFIVAISNPVANIIYGFGALYIPKQKNWPDIFRKNL